MCNACGNVFGLLCKGADEDRMESVEQPAKRKKMLVACIALAVLVLVAVIIIVFTVGHAVSEQGGMKVATVQSKFTACEPGYQQTDFGCTDIDECLTGRCMKGIHICQNFPGSFICTCNSSAGFFPLHNVALNVPDRVRIPPCKSCGSYRLIPGKWSDRTDRDWTIHMWGEERCSKICACANGPCDMRTGQCPGNSDKTRCLGHEEPLFSESSQSCNNISDEADCFQAWGGFCERKCHCKGNEACETDTGKCSNNDCDENFTGDFCHIPLASEMLCEGCDSSRGLMCTPKENLLNNIDAVDKQLGSCVCKDDLMAYHEWSGKCAHKLYKNCDCIDEAWCLDGVRAWDNPCLPHDPRLRCLQFSETGYICAQNSNKQ